MLSIAKRSPSSTCWQCFSPNGTTEVFGLLCCRGMSLARVQFVVQPDPQVLFCKTASQLLGPSARTGAWVYSPPGSWLAFSFVELHILLLGNGFPQWQYLLMAWKWTYSGRLYTFPVVNSVTFNLCQLQK